MIKVFYWCSPPSLHQSADLLSFSTLFTIDSADTVFEFILL